MALATDSEAVSWLFGASDRRAMSLDLQGIEVDGRAHPVTPPLRWLQPADFADRSTVVAALRRLSWLSAERTGPREILPLLDPEHHARVGARGELAAGLLHWRGDEQVEPALCLSDEIPTLFHQVRAWMRRFFPGVDFRLSPVDGTNAITLQMRSSAKADFHRPQNVGFGLSQLFPVIVALMAARPGDTVAVENPEVHLHPRAQQDVGILLCRVAAAGVQVVAETHSDHVVNGIRLAVRQGVVAPDQTAIHFFTRSENGTADVVSPRLNTEARFDAWPTGFFDQYDAALSELL
jgi:predicted ATPase